MKTTMLVLALLLTSGVARADAKKASNDVARAVTGGSGYGMAGCGLGTFIFKENNATQILAATTNGTSGSQTFGITFGTSNCGSSGSLVMKNQVKDFVAANQAALASEAAKGNGETLDGLASLMGVQNRAEFAALVQQNHGKLFSSSISAGDLTEKLFEIASI